MPEQISSLPGTLWAGLNSGFSRFMTAIPSLIGAVIILFAGWYISKFVGRIVETLAERVGADSIAEKAHIGQYMPTTQQGRKFDFSEILGGMAKWFLFLIFVQSAAITVGIPHVTSIINSIIMFIPNVLVAAVILVCGAWAARFCSELVQNSTARMGLSNPNLPPLLVRYGILGFSFIAALSQLGIATNLINILFVGLVAALSLAFGLAFGLGGRGVASDITRSWVEKGRTISSSGGVGGGVNSTDRISH